MSVDLAGRVALVTGAGKGLGRAYALWLADRGAQVVVNNRSRPGRASTAAAVVAEIERGGGSAVVDEHPVEFEDAGHGMVATALEAFGRLDILVCNAGVVVRDEDYRKLDVAEFHRVMDINFWGSVYPVAAALPQMSAQRYGRIVMTISSAGLFGQAGSAAYGASRAGIIGFARSVALDIPEDEDIRINMVSPSAYTDASSGSKDASYAELMSPGKVAPVVGWLCSDACRESGLILHAGCGRVRRVKIVGGRAIDVPDEDLGRCWPDLEDMTGAEEAPYASAAGRVLRPEVPWPDPETV